MLALGMLLVISMLLPISTFAAELSIKNGSFEEQSGSSAILGWEIKSWVEGQDAHQVSVDKEQSFSGSSSLSIHNLTDNHVRAVQTIDVESSAYYKISTQVKAEGFRPEAAGAHIQIEDVAAYYPEVLDTAGKWQQIELYVQTEADQKKMTIGLSAGGYSRSNVGQAWFDDVFVERLEQIPAGAEVFAAKAAQKQSTENEGKQDKPRSISIWPIMLIVVLFTVFYFGHTVRRMDKAALSPTPSSEKFGFAIFMVLLSAFFFRLAIAVGHEGFVNDIALFKHWAKLAVDNGLAGLYSGDVFLDYPPGYVYVLFGLGKFHQWFHIAYSSSLSLILFKLPAIIADLIAAWLIYHAASKKMDGKAAVLLSALYVFNPFIWTDSAAWGQVDSIFSLFLVWSIIKMTERRIVAASILFAITALIKPQAFIFMPVLLLMLLHNKKLRTVLTSAITGFASFILLALPFFWGHGGVGALIKLYKTTLSSYPYAVLNSFNIYALTGGNWKSIEQKFLFIPYSVWGGIAIGLAVLLALYYSMSTKRSGIKIKAALGEEHINRSYFIAFLLIATVFLFVTKMHERYMFPFALLAIFAYIQSLDRRLLHLFYGFSITNFINIAIVLAYNKQTSQVPVEGLFILGTIVNLMLFLYLLYTGYDLYVCGNRSVKEYEESALVEKRYIDSLTKKESRQKKQGERRLSRKGWLVMFIITAVYAIVALFNLGSVEGPVTVWQPQKSGQSFYVDFGAAKQLDRVTSFGGVGHGKYKIEFAVEPGQWENPLELENTHVSVFAWNTAELKLKARYAKLTVTESGFSMHELGFYEQGMDKPVAIQEVVYDKEEKARRGAIEQLFDEQALMVPMNDYWYGSYFDEIYHARTAYEHLEGIKAYESTHPPLGKLILAMGIKLFGLNPFGWRIAGTIIGILMLPILYMTAYRILGRVTYASAATILFAADFMHFSQTRIATIDVYGVFFIMLMFYFMHRYVSMSFYKDGLLKTFIPLGTAGVMFGLGVAAKWIAVYGGAGLAVMLALSLFDRYREYRAAKNNIDEAATSFIEQHADQANKPAELVRAATKFPSYLFSTLAFCIVFYVVIPLGIYMLSYIPVLKAMDSGYTLKAFIEYQKNMFNYHSNLVSSHPFSSSWWEWPFMKRPVWYFSGKMVDEGMKSTIAAFGNPLIWWTGIFAVLLTVWFSIKRRDKAMYTVWIAYFSQYIPWMLVTRETFLYHYFAMVPFMVVSIVYLFKIVEERYPRAVRIRYGYVAAAVILFVLFYPALSGLAVPWQYIDYVLRWFPTWVF